MQACSSPLRRQMPGRCEAKAAALACSCVRCPAVLHNSDRDVAAARTFERALFIQGAGLDSREPHVRAAFRASRMEDASGSDLRSTRRSIKHGATLAETTLTRLGRKRRSLGL